MFSHAPDAGTPPAAPDAITLLERTQSSHREAGDKHYATYLEQRALLIEHLMHARCHGLDESPQYSLDWLCAIPLGEWCFRLHSRR